MKKYFVRYSISVDILRRESVVIIETDLIKIACDKVMGHFKEKVAEKEHCNIWNIGILNISQL